MKASVLFGAGWDVRRSRAYKEAAVQVRPQNSDGGEDCQPGHAGN